MARQPVNKLEASVPVVLQAESSNSASAAPWRCHIVYVSHVHEQASTARNGKRGEINEERTSEYSEKWEERRDKYGDSKKEVKGARIRMGE